MSSSTPPITVPLAPHPSHPSTSATPLEWSPDRPLVSTEALAMRYDPASSSSSASSSSLSPPPIDANGRRLWVIDGSWPKLMSRDAKLEFEHLRLPNALQFDLDTLSDSSSPYPNMLPPTATIGKWVDSLEEKFGVLPNPAKDDFVVYDSMGLFAAPRVWWTLVGFGFHRTFLLDGGLPKWISEGRPVETSPPTSPSPSKLEATDPSSSSSSTMISQFPKSMVVDFDQVQHISTTGTMREPSLPVCLLDARGAARYSGGTAEPRKGMTSGHIPKAVNLPYSELLVEREYLKPKALDGLPGCDGGQGGGGTVTMKYWSFKDVESLKHEILKRTGINVDSLAELGEVSADSKTGRTSAPIERVVCSCGSGVTAVVLLFGMRLCGVPMSRLVVYDGSWTEWSMRGGATEN